jgi:acetoin utilization deacetylase AcuC-like enzyme
MILYDPSLTMRFMDYGIMIPISPDRAERVLEFLGRDFYPGARGETMPYPGPVFGIADALNYLGEGENTLGSAVISRRDLERIHSREFIAVLFGEDASPDTSAMKATTLGTLETALLHSYELIDSQGRPHRYEPGRAKKPLTDLFNLILAQTTGTYLACRLALAEGPGFCYYLGGGMHHARYDSGSGFCLINDIAIAAAKILADTAGTSYQAEFGSAVPGGMIWIIDLDAHKGDGTAELVSFARKRGELADPENTGSGAAVNAAGTGAPCILTLSIHMDKGWPLDAESLAAAHPGRAPLAASDIDIGIDSGEEAEYTPRLKAGIKELERISADLRRSGRVPPGIDNIPEKPDLILVVDGADPYEHDGLPSSGLLKLSLEQCLARDNFVYRYAMDQNIPAAWVQAGGYGERAWEPPAYFLQGIR